MGMDEISKDSQKKSAEDGIIMEGKNAIAHLAFFCVIMQIGNDTHT
jgi:hypothetical protein